MKPLGWLFAASFASFSVPRADITPGGRQHLLKHPYPKHGGRLRNATGQENCFLNECFLPQVCCLRDLPFRKAGSQKWEA